MTFLLLSRLFQDFQPYIDKYCLSIALLFWRVLKAGLQNADRQVICYPVKLLKIHPGIWWNHVFTQVLCIQRWYPATTSPSDHVGLVFLENDQSSRFSALRISALLCHLICILTFNLDDTGVFVPPNFIHFNLVRRFIVQTQYVEPF